MPRKALCNFVLCALSLLLISQQPLAQSDGLTAKVDAVFASYNKPDSPGCALGVIKNGKLIYTRGYGLANLEHNLPNGAEIVYDIGSTSKQFTAASILLLAQQGKLALDDDVRKLIPELPQYQKPITIRHLLQHTSGLRDYLTLFSLAGVNFDDTTTENDALKIILRQQGLNFAPGDEWLYSNSGFFLLSIIVKRASGKSLAEFARDQIFAPLGMTHTLILDNHKRLVPRRATGYSPAPGGGWQIEMSNFEQTGDGAVQTSINDLLLWDRNFYEPKVGGAALLKQLHEVGALNSGEKHGYAAGLFVDEYKGLRRVAHGGAWAGFRAELLRFPDQQFSVACLCNLGTTNPSQLALRVADVYLADQFKTDALVKADAPSATNAPVSAAPVTLSESELQAKVGLYRNAASGELRRITQRDGKLRVDPFGPNSIELIPLGKDRFRVASNGNEIAFETAAGQSQLKLTRNGRTEIFASVPTAAPTGEDLAAYAGRYFSPELDTTFDLQVGPGGLAFSGKDAPKRPLLPTYRDGFISSGVLFEFQRDAQHKISGFTLSAGRIRHVRFVREGATSETKRD